MANETNPVPARSDESGGPDTAGLPVAAVVPADEADEALAVDERMARVAPERRFRIKFFP